MIWTQDVKVILRRMVRRSGGEIQVDYIFALIGLLSLRIRNVEENYKSSWKGAGGRWGGGMVERGTQAK